MEVSREERCTDVAQESSPGQMRSYMDGTHVRDLCCWGGCSVAGIQGTVEWAGAQSLLTALYSGQGGFLPGRRFLRPSGRWKRKRLGVWIWDAEYRIALMMPVALPCPLGGVACEEGALSGDCIWLLAPGWGPDSPSVAATHPSVINTQKCFLHPASSFSCV